MTGRTWLLLLVGAVLVAAALLWTRRPPDVEPPYDWDWRSVTRLPFDGAVLAGAGELQPVRVLVSDGDLWLTELLWTVGLTGVAPGEAPTHSGAIDEVLVVPSSRCGEAVVQHVEAGGAALVIAPCDELRSALGLPERTVWEASGAEATATTPSGTVEHLPLPPAGREWVSSGWQVHASRDGGGPLVVSRGRVVATSFDLPTWLRHLRQGEPSLAGVDSDGMHGTKPNDLRPFPWSDEAWRQPGADAWSELLAWAIGQRLADPPLARAWPLPTAATSAVVLTFDQDFAPAQWVETLLARAEAVGGEATLLTTHGTRQTNTEPVLGEGGEWLSRRGLQYAQAWGHGIGLHPNAAGLNDPIDFDGAIVAHDGRLRGLVPADDVRAVRHHYLLWWGVDEPMLGLLDLRYWMDLTFVGIDPARSGPGFQFGSGRPARWHTARGELLAILSQSTQVEDDVLVGDLAYAAGLSPAEAAQSATDLLDVAARWRVPLTVNLHPLGVADDSAVLLDGILAGATSSGAPIISAERWATFWWARLRVLSGEPWDVRVPLLRWTPEGVCAEPVAASPLSGPGCLEAWASP